VFGTTTPSVVVLKVLKLHSIVAATALIAAVVPITAFLRSSSDISLKVTPLELQKDDSGVPFRKAKHGGVKVGEFHPKYSPIFGRGKH